ncbi:MAG: thioredoxin family protein [Polyangiales bacterium]
MTRRQALVFAIAVCAALGLIATYKLGPRYYNRYRLQQLQGRHIYDTQADTHAAFAAGLAQANKEHKRLVVMLGGNWCQWCLALDDLMHTDTELRAYLDRHFVVLKLDSAAAKTLDDAWGKPTRHGVPVLIFVDESGGVRHIQETVSLELWHGRILGHDPERVLELLERWT